jgi:beta-glucosidase/6-phospho-beta-glucosidase/beta-galactosidase
VYVPFKVNVNYYDVYAPYTLDWVGVNTYSNKKRYLMSDIVDKDFMLTTQNPNYRFYPQGIARAVKTVYERMAGPASRRNEKCVPIWITENGIAAHTEEQRELFFKQGLMVIKTLIDEGYPIMGYTPWASHDNYEWGAPAGSKRYGMFHVDFADNLRRTLKKGSLYSCQFVEEVLRNL